MILRVVELIADGAIGAVTGVQADFGVAGPFPPEHRMRNAALGGGALLDLGIYPISLAHLLLGRAAAHPRPGRSSARRGRTRTPACCSATTPERWRP